MAERYNWEGFKIGETRAFAHRYRQSVITSFKSFARARGWKGYCSTKSDPPSPKHGQPCNMVWITRIEPKEAELGAGETLAELDSPEASGPKRASDTFEAPRDASGRLIRTQPIILDMREIPIEARIEVYERRNHRVRLSKRGWDRMRLNAYDFSHARIGDLKSQIVLACLARNLLFRFEIRRVRSPEGADDTRVWYLVTRTR
jgi:hypothetical protein